MSTKPPDDDGGEALFRTAMTRATQTLPPLPDLAPQAMSLGRRRRARTRAAMTGAAFATVTVLALGLTVLPSLTGRTDDGPAAPAAPSSGIGSPSAASPKPDGSAGPPSKEERARLADYQKKAAGRLDVLLPDAMGAVNPVSDDDMRSYLARAGERAYPVALTVRRSPGASLRPCEDDSAKGLTCRVSRLEDGRVAHVYTLPRVPGSGTEVSLQFREGDSEVSLTVSPDKATGAAAPVTVKQLLTGVSDPGFRQLLQYADRHPVLVPGAGRGQ
ncbi:hypothetical protein AB0C40_03075 [Streptomyces brevispora]|uniref:hypothetical protein n=1 Tax=Streptomyces brevispora TaxID=887462 RepID=UPI0033F94E26